MMTDDIHAQLSNKAEAKGLDRCCSCGYTWKTGTNGFHCCSEFMVPKDVLKIMLTQNNDTRAILKMLKLE